MVVKHNSYFRLLRRLLSLSLILQIFSSTQTLNACGQRISDKFVQTVVTATQPPKFAKDAIWNRKPEPEDFTDATEYLNDEAFQKLYTPIKRERARDIYYLVGVTQYIFRKHGIRVFLPNGGTTIGMLRNGGQLPHDDDADFTILKSDKKKIWSLRSEFRHFGLDLRDMKGVSIQVVPQGARTTAGVAWAQAKNSFFNKYDDSKSWLGKKLAVTARKLRIRRTEITTHGFIDLIAMEYDETVDAYRYTDFIARAVWWHQTMSKEYVEAQELELYPYGPLALRAPAREICEEEINKVYPGCLTQIMKTPDHSMNETKLYESFLLTEKQKQPYPLTEDDVAELDQRFNKHGLMRTARGEIVEFGVHR